MRPAVFLDRDGVLNKMVLRNEQPGSPRRVEEFQLLPGVRQAVELLRRAGLLVVVVTNQPDVARGFLPLGELERLHKRLRQWVPVDAIYTCPHDDADECTCRKPKPGLLLQASQEWNIRLPHSYMVGDSWKDIAAGQRAGCKTFLVQNGQRSPGDIAADVVIPDLPAAVRKIRAAIKKADHAA